MIVFRGKFRAFTLKALQQGKLQLPPDTTHSYWVSELNRLGRVPWNVKVFDRYQHGRGVVQYLARYLRGGPIGNARLLDCREGHVRFRYRVPASPAADRTRQGIMMLTIMEFLLRLLEHVPPRGLQTARGYGLYAGNQHSGLQHAFTALGATPPQVPGRSPSMSQLLEAMGLDATSNCCPVCGQPLIVEHEWRPYWKPARSPPAESDTSLTPASTPA